MRGVLRAELVGIFKERTILLLKEGYLKVGVRHYPLNIKNIK